MPNFDAWTKPTNSIRENALLIAAHLCDVEHVREVGVNRGFWVERFLAGVGLGPGYSWCAAFVAFALKQAGWKDLPKGAAAVRNWASWAKANGRITAKPERGDLFFWLNADGTGHMGFVVEATPTTVRTIEGNTNTAGSREGDGCYRRTRSRADVSFISMKL